MDFKRDYLQMPEDPKSTIAFQLAVEQNYLTEEFDLTLPHTLHHDTAIVNNRYRHMSQANWLRIQREVKGILEEKEIPFELFRKHKSHLHRYTHRRVTECYKKYERHYLSEGIDIEV